MSATETLPATRTPMAVGQRGIIINDMDSLWRFSTAVAKSGLAPKGIQTGEAIFVAIQMGLEVGLTPMAALQNIAVINGRPSIWGDAQLALVRGTGELEAFEEWFETDGEKLPRNPVKFEDSTTAVCRVKRKGYPASEVGFSVQDAKTAGLWGKEGPWRQYPFRMLRSRARSFALRDTFGDALKGIMSGEEAQDAPIIEVNSQPVFTRAAKEAREVGEQPVDAPAGGGTATPTVIPTVEPAKVEGNIVPKVQDELRIIIHEAGKTFEDCMSAASKFQDLSESDKSAKRFEELSDDLCLYLTRNKRGLLRAIGGAK